MILSLLVVVKPLCAPVTIIISPRLHRILCIPPLLILRYLTTRSSYTRSRNPLLICVRTASSSNAFSTLRPYWYTSLEFSSIPLLFIDLTHLVLKLLFYKIFLITQPLLVPLSCWNNLSINKYLTISSAALSKSLSYRISGNLSSVRDYSENSVKNNKSL
jgi:hypothetical protein